MSNGDEHRQEKVILYVSRFADDNQGKLYEQQLAGEGYSTLLTDSGFSAAAVLNRGCHVVDLVILGRKNAGNLQGLKDQVPGMQDIGPTREFVPGIERLEDRIISMGDNAPPVIIHSSAPPEVVMEQYLGRPIAAHIVAYIQKSADPTPFLNAVHGALYSLGR